MIERKTKGEYVFDILNHLILFLLAVVCLYPMLYVLFASLSNPAELSRSGGLLLYPKGIQFDSYAAVFQNEDIVSGYMNTIFYVVVGTFLNIILTILGAYVLSRKNFVLRGFFMFMITFTMFVSGGLVPGYLLVKDIGLLNSRWALVLPVAINTYNLIMTRTFFNTIPDALEEAAKIDGASHFKILFVIMVPLAVPIIAVIALYYGVSHWNSWFNAMIYLNNRSKFPLQLILREILILSQTESMMEGSTSIDRQSIAENIKYATIVVATVPILCVYPLLQKYFAKGVMIGAIKG